MTQYIKKLYYAGLILQQALSQNKLLASLELNKHVLGSSHSR